MSEAAPSCEIHQVPQIERLRRVWGLDPYYLRRLRHALFQEGRSDEESFDRLPAEIRDRFRQEVSLHPLRLVTQQQSSLDGSVKRLLETTNGRRIESVILDTPTGRSSLCVSSQVGCRAGCKFCATAAMPDVQNLSTGEILDQIVQANQLLRTRGRRVRNLVFMGMGEPLHNEEAVTAALETLSANDGFNFSLQKTIVSSVGVPAAMIRLARRFPRLRIAWSLHSADQAVREQLIPVAKKHSVWELRETLEEVVGIQGQHVMIQYLMLNGLTDTETACDQLLELLDGLQCYVNLIPYNEIPGEGVVQTFRATSQQRREAFAERLRGAGFMTYIRYSQGADIDAACGQLANRT